MVIGRIHFAKKLEYLVDEYRLYPDKGDMRKVRPGIRAMEVGFRSLEFGDEGHQGPPLPPDHSNQFWSEMKAKTLCIVASEFERPTDPPNELREELLKLLETVHHHFDETLTTTAPDPHMKGRLGSSYMRYRYSLTFRMAGAICWSRAV
jgi:hypothetical protein